MFFGSESVPIGIFTTTSEKILPTSVRFRENLGSNLACEPFPVDRGNQQDTAGGHRRLLSDKKPAPSRRAESSSLSSAVLAGYAQWK